jgi:hypothetical protein
VASRDWPQFSKQPKQLLRINMKVLPEGDTIDKETSSKRKTSVNEILTAASVIGTGDSRNCKSRSLAQISADCMAGTVPPEQTTSCGRIAGYVPKFEPVMLMAPNSCDVMPRVRGVLYVKADE